MFLSMEMKQKRGWFKFALTTTMAIVFMFAMAVTAFGRATVSVRPSEVIAPGDYAVNLDVFVDIAGTDLVDHGVCALVLRAQWDTSVLSFERTPGPVVQPVEGSGWVISNQPPASQTNDGFMYVRFHSEEFDDVLNTLDSGPIGRLRFSVADGTVLNLDVAFAIDFVGAFDANGQAIAVTGDATLATPAIQMSMTRVIWGAYRGATADELSFINAVTGAHAAWFAFFEQVVDIVRTEYNPNADGARINEIWQGWIAYNEANA